MSSFSPAQDGSSRIAELCYGELKLWDFVKKQKQLINHNKTLACCWLHDSTCVLSLEYHNDGINNEPSRKLMLCLRDANPPNKPAQWTLLSQKKIESLFNNHQSLTKNDADKVILSPGHLKFNVNEEEQHVLVSFQGCSVAALIKTTRNRSMMHAGPNRTSKKSVILPIGSIEKIGELDLLWSAMALDSPIYETDIIRAVWKMVCSSTYMLYGYMYVFVYT
jgi:hypothetical protein